MKDAEEYRARPAVYAVDLDGEVLIWVDDLQQLHRLNVPASHVWWMLGRWTNAEVIADAIADGQRERDAIVADVAACIDELLALRLVDRRVIAASQN